MSAKAFLMPREHGAYAQLAFPLLSGLLVGGPSIPGVALALATVLLFLAYEPIVVLMGTRGVRLQNENGEVAHRQLRLLLPFGLISGVQAVWFATPLTRLLIVVPLLFCGAVVALIPGERVKTLKGEVLVLCALSAMHLPLAAAGGATGVRLWGPAVVWMIIFFIATLAVHSIKARQKQRDEWVVTAAASSATFCFVAAAVLFFVVPDIRRLIIAAAAPLLAVTVVNAAGLHPRALKQIGWALVTMNTVSLVLFAFL